MHIVAIVIVSIQIDQRYSRKTTTYYTSVSLSRGTTFIDCNSCILEKKGNYHNVILKGKRELMNVYVLVLHLK
jgi:hypothetical protein